MSRPLTANTSTIPEAKDAFEAANFSAPNRQEALLALKEETTVVRDKEALAAMLSQAVDNKLTISYRPNTGPGIKTMEIRAADDSFPPSVDGRIVGFSLQLPFSSLPPETRRDVEQFRESKDSSGNVIRYARDRRTDVVTIGVTTTASFAPGEDQRFCFDTSKLVSAQTNSSVGDKSGIFLHDVSPPVGHLGSLPIQSQIQDEKVKKLLTPERLTAMQSQGDNASQLFGAADLGGYVRSVQVIDETFSNAYASFDGSVFMLTDEMLKNSPAEVGRVAYHEVIHLIDERHDISGSNGFSQLFNKLHDDYLSSPDPKSCFLVGISESRFLPTAEGGHSWENGKELLASLMTVTFGVSDEEWRSSVVKKDAAFRADYIKALSTLQEVMRDAHRGIPQDAPIFRKLEERIQELKSL